MALESLPKIAPALFSAEQDLIQIYNKKSDTTGVINPSYIKSSPSGVSGAIQFSDGSAFASDASNLFWDDTNKRLGVRTNTPAYGVDVFSNVSSSMRVRSALSGSYIDYTNSFGSTHSFGTNGNAFVTVLGGTVTTLLSSDGTNTFGNSLTSLGARVGIKGSGSTSATTSLLVQNSAGAASLTVRDNQTILTSGLGVGSGGNVGQVNFNLSADFTVSTPTNINFKNGYTDTSLFFMSALGDSIGIKNTSPHASAIFDIASTTKGFLPPRQTVAQRTAIVSPAIGLMVYQTDGTEGLYIYKSTGWTFIA